MTKIILSEVNINDDIVQGFKAKLNEINELLPFLIDLTTEERKSGSKIGPNRRDFVNEMRDVANDHPEILPPIFDKDRFIKAVIQEKPLDDFEKLISGICEKISDTHLDVGRIAFTDALNVYKYLNNVQGMDELQKKAKKYFEKAKKDNHREE